MFGTLSSTSSNFGPPISGGTLFQPFQSNVGTSGTASLGSTGVNLFSSITGPTQSYGVTAGSSTVTNYQDFGSTGSTSASFTNAAQSARSNPSIDQTSVFGSTSSQPVLFSVNSSQVFNSNPVYSFTGQTQSELCSTSDRQSGSKQAIDASSAPILGSKTSLFGSSTSQQSGILDGQTAQPGGFGKTTSFNTPFVSNSQPGTVGTAGLGSNSGQSGIFGTASSSDVGSTSTQLHTGSLDFGSLHSGSVEKNATQFSSSSCSHSSSGLSGLLVTQSNSSDLAISHSGLFSSQTSTTNSGSGTATCSSGFVFSSSFNSGLAASSLSSGALSSNTVSGSEVSSATNPEVGKRGLSFGTVDNGKNQYKASTDDMETRLHLLKSIQLEKVDTLVHDWDIRVNSKLCQFEKLAEETLAIDRDLLNKDAVLRSILNELTETHKKNEHYKTLLDLIENQQRDLSNLLDALESELNGKLLNQGVFLSSDEQLIKEQIVDLPSLDSDNPLYGADYLYRVSTVLNDIDNACLEIGTSVEELMESRFPKNIKHIFVMLKTHDAYIDLLSTNVQYLDTRVNNLIQRIATV